jgi:hypothetical protein
MTVQLRHAVEFEIRRRPIGEQFPDDLKEVMTSLKTTAESLRATLEIQKSITGWQQNFNKTLESVFTNIALEHLRTVHPNNNFINVFEDCEISKKWSSPDFELDGLIYDEIDHIFYMIESKYFLTTDALGKTATTFANFVNFTRMKKPELQDRSKLATRWVRFFEGERSITRGRDGNEATVKVFLGFHACDSESLLDEAKSKSYMLIGPDGSHYKLLD